MNDYERSISKTMYAFGFFLILTDLILLILSFANDMPFMRYVVYGKLTLNITNLFIIYKKHYLTAVFIMYIVIIAFMISAIICMGLEPGFHLYVISLLATLHYISYVNVKMTGKKIKAVPAEIFIVLCYALSCAYVRTSGALYPVSKLAGDLLFGFNSAIVIIIIVFYMHSLMDIVNDSEQKLSDMAMLDKLTGLYNRHYLLSLIDKISESDRKNCWIAILDIDNFKQVNDIYGHICGDIVLKEIADITKDVCSDCTVCRWGGEEFVILSKKISNKTVLLEKLRETVQDKTFYYDDKQLSVTVTIGAEEYTPGLSADLWISRADEKLYTGKKSGKNRIVA